jgi:hypothetical protein
MSPDAVADLDPLLAPLAAPLRRAADSLLELREAARSGETPGRCIRCYFQLLAAASRDVQPRLTPLRAWLENHIEAAASDADGRLLEVIPVRLDADDLETCCRGIMREMHEDRAYDTPSIRLDFRYKSSGSALAGGAALAAA